MVWPFTISPALWLWLLAVGVDLVVGVTAFLVASQRLEQHRARCQGARSQPAK